MTKIFLSYDLKTHKTFSAELSTALVTRGFKIWQDQKRRRSLARVLQQWRNPGGEFGLDHWLRDGILQSDIVVVLIPYDRKPDHFPDTWSLVRPATADELIRFVAEEVEDLHESYFGRASSKWDDPRHLDQAAYYLLRPVHSWRMAWYEKHFGKPLGKDTFEHWRRWEMRIAGALTLPVVLVVLIDQREDQFAESVANWLTERSEYVVLRSSSLKADMNARLFPAITRAIPSPEKAATIRESRRRIRRVQLRAKVTVWLWALLAGLVVTMIVLGLRLLIR